MTGNLMPNTARIHRNAKMAARGLIYVRYRPFPRYTWPPRDPLEWLPRCLLNREKQIFLVKQTT